MKNKRRSSDRIHLFSYIQLAESFKVEKRTFSFEQGKIEFEKENLQTSSLG